MSGKDTSNRIKADVEMKEQKFRLRIRSDLRSDRCCCRGNKQLQELIKGRSAPLLLQPERLPLHLFLPHLLFLFFLLPPLDRLYRVS